LPLARQCELAGVARSTAYAPRRLAEPDPEELALLALIDEEYTRHPFYGSRKMVVYLRNLGHWVNRKRVQRLMGVLGLAGMAPGPDTSRPHPQHKAYPYLARGGWGLTGPTKSGAPTSPMSGCRGGLCIWWR
jgi:putative transposase